MNELLLVGLAGFLAAIVDGALGMGFGPTSSSILLSTGISPAAVSATVNVAKIASGLAGGIAHWRLRNIDRRLVVRLATGGAIGALIGTTILANVDGDELRPYLAVLLALVGARILIRFSKPVATRREHTATAESTRGVGAAAVAGGITNGLVGAWGPVVTPFLLQRIPPRIAIGTVNTAEVAVAIVSVGVLLSSLGGSGIELELMAAMLVGGVIAAPLAAYLVRFLPARALGLAVAGLLLMLQARELASALGLGASRWVVYGALALALVVAACRPIVARWRTGNTTTPAVLNSAVAPPRASESDLR